MSNAPYANRVALLEQQLAESKAAADAALSAAHAEYEASKANVIAAQTERDAAVARALEAEKRADDYGKFITAAGYIADVVVFSPDDFSEILERLKNFRIEADKLRERLQFDPGGSDRIDELEMATDMLRTRAEAAEARAEAAAREAEYLCAAMEAREFDRDAEDLYKHAEEAEQSDTPQGRERARRLIAAAEAAEAKANAIMAKVNTASGPLKAKEVSDDSMGQPDGC